MEEKKISMYDPTINAYREIPISLAKKFVEEALKMKEQIEELENN